MSNPFQTLHIKEDSTEQTILKAWRALSLEHHPDKTGVVDDTYMKILNEAKERCLDTVIRNKYTISEREFVLHICAIAEKKLTENSDMHFDLSDGFFILPFLRQHMWFRAVDAMEWVLHCAAGDAVFDQDVEDEIPILRKYYNSFIGEDAWTDNDQTMMKVLNRYDQIKAGGYGNFTIMLVDVEK